MNSKRNDLVRSLAVGAALLTGGLVTTSAQAWQIPGQFAGTPYRTSGGNYYTGSPRSVYSCDACHVGAERFAPTQRISMRVTTELVQGGNLQNYDLFASGYVPGDRYRISVEIVGEHRGHHMSNGQYEDAEGAFWKLGCPAAGQSADFLANVHNKNHITVEVMNEDEVYASFQGNEAGRLSADTPAGGTAESTQCLNTDRCTGNDNEPAHIEAGGPTSVMLRRYELVDANANPPFGEWACGVCDAIVSNTQELTPGDENAPFTPLVMRFFWTAPAQAPATGGGRVRFYMAGVDGDGYADTLDDDFASLKVAVCPAGAPQGQCDPMVGPDWGLGIVSAPPGSGTRSSSGATMSRHGDIPWLPIAGMTLALAGLVLGATRRWVGARPA